MEIEYIRTKERTYFNKANLADDNVSLITLVYDICHIIKLEDGSFKIDFNDVFYDHKNFKAPKDEPNSRIILYPAGIEYVKYIKGERLK